MKKNKLPEQVEVTLEFGTYVRSTPFCGKPGEVYPVTFFSTGQLDQYLKSGHLRYVEGEQEKITIEIVEENQNPTMGE